MQTIEFKHVFQEHIQPFLSLIDLINLTQICQHGSPFIATKICIKTIIITKIEQVLKNMFKDDHDFFMWMMREHNMIITGPFIFQCVMGEEITKEFELIFEKNIFEEIETKIYQKKYIFLAKRTFKLPNNIRIDISHDRNVDNLHSLDVHKNYWSPNKLYIHRLIDMSWKIMIYESIILDPRSLIKYYDMGFKIIKDDRALSNTEVRDELIKCLNIAYYDLLDYTTDEKIKKYLERDTWYALREPTLWSNGEQYIIRRSTGIYKRLDSSLQIFYIEICRHKCITRYTFPDREHFHIERVFKNCGKENVIFLNDFI